jgi:predicted ATP-dependent endonuclease of OLD family
MKLKKLILKNFKAYKEAEIDFNNISVIVGKNDAGKSTILQALNLFFNPKDASKADIFYKNSNDTAKEILIECHFDISADEVKLGGEDKGVLITETNLLNKDGYFVVGYKYTEKSLSKSPFISESYVKCHNYDISALDWSSKKNSLEQMNKKELDEAIKTLKITKPDNTDGRENHWKRKAIEADIVSQNINKSCIEIALGEKKDKEDRLTPVIDRLPKFKLFSNDKANSIGDKENSAVIENEIKNIIAEQMKSQLEEINKAMQAGMQAKLSSLNETYKHFFNFLGQDTFTLQDGTPAITFKTNGIVDNKGLNIENRGSGFRRLALLSLHLSAHTEEEYKDMIFAIEEPETSQNPHNQRGIIDAMHKLTDKGSQIIITTHSPAMAKEFSGENVEYTVVENNGDLSNVKKYNTRTELFDDIVNLLGILPVDINSFKGKKLIIFVEGYDDAIILHEIGKIKKVLDIVFAPTDGSSMPNYINLNYLGFLGLPYGMFIDKIKPNEHWQTQAKQVLEMHGYGSNIKEAQQNDISHYVTPKLNKKELRKAIKNGEIIQVNTQYSKEIDEWFSAFETWKTNQGTTMTAEEVVYIEQPSNQECIELLQSNS